ncbi:MAG: tetratricopeptide repeat protein [Bacteroidota bacterium]
MAAVTTLHNHQSKKNNMDPNAVKKLYTQVSEDLHNRRVLDAIENLKKLIALSGREYYNDQLAQQSLTYNNILKHSFGTVKDPQRIKIYLYLKRNLLEMADELQETILTDQASGNIYHLKKQFDRTKTTERTHAMAYLESLAFDKELSSILGEGIISEEKEMMSHDEALVKIFNIIWLSDKYTEEEIKLLNAVCDSELLPWYDKSLIVSALTLSLLRYFDVNKFLLLFRFVQVREQYSWQRALVGIFLCFLKYNDRFYLYPVLEEKTREMADMDDMQKNLEAILIQFTKTRETESVSKKWREDILPAMMKLRPKIEEKLDLENIFKDEFGEEKNPDWETVFEDAPDLLDKLQQFTEMQMEGMDVFMSAFSQLKNFPFFYKISNWLVPFYMENQSIQPYLKNPDGSVDLTPLVEKLEKTYFMCNSDKYSFCINLGMIPDQQKNMMLNMASAEMESMSEIEKSEGLINEFATTKSIFTQYFQDLYRFFRLHPWRSEFDDVFRREPDIFNSAFIRNVITDSKTIRNIAEFYFDKQFYPYALHIFLSLLQRDSQNTELFEKIAFCYEKSGDFQNALTFYKKAELIETNRLWIIRKIAFCSKFLNHWDEALSYYRLAEKQNPDDMKIQANIGQCLIHLEQYEEALQYYFKVEVLAPENHKIRRPLAWCSFVLGKFETAEDYFNRLLAKDPENRFDLLSAGHTLWCMKKEQQALEAYRKSLASFSNFRSFETAFLEDKKHLIKHGIDEFELDLMIEYLKSDQNQPV